MGKFDRQIATATRLIAAFGELVIWQSRSETSDASKPWRQTENTTTDHEVSIVFLTQNRIGAETKRYIKGSEVSSGSVKGFMGAEEVTPKINDTVLRSGVLYRVKSIQTLAPNDQTILHEIEFDA